MDETLFDQTYKTYYHPLRFYAARFVQPENAEDIIENVFMKVWDKKPRFDNPEHLRAFLYQATRNACLDFLKAPRNNSRSQLAVSDEHLLPEADHLQQLIQAEVLGEIYRAVNDLPSQCSKVIRRGYLEGASNAEIAAEMGLSEQTVKNYKGRGLALLKDKLSGNAFTFLLLLVHWR